MNNTTKLGSERNLILTTEQDERNHLKSHKNRTLPQLLHGYTQMASPQSLLSKIRSVPKVFVNRYIKKMHTRIAKQRNMKNLDHSHFELINDRSFGSQQEKHRLFQIQSRCVDQLKHQLQLLLSEIPLIYPDSPFRIIFDMVATMSRLYFLYLIPIDLAWKDQQFLFTGYVSYTVACLIILLIDFLLGFNTAFYKAGQIQTDRLIIFKRNITKLGGLEWISTLIIWISFLLYLSREVIIDVSEQSYQLILILFLVHHVNVNKIMIQYEVSLQLGKKALSIIQLLKLLLLFFYVIHLFSCLWFWAGSYSNRRYQESWLEAAHILDQEWDVQYLASFYYACVTCFTVGYGDITPKSNLEKLLSVIFIMISSIQLPYSVNTVGLIIEQVTSDSEQKRNKLRTFNSYLKRKNIPYNLQFELREYLNHYWQLQNQEETEEEKAIITQLSERLRDKLLIQANSQIINQSLLFRNQFSQPFKISLLKCVRQQVIQPEQIVEVDNNDRFMCFIEEGELEVFIDSGSRMKLKTTEKGNTLGTLSFLIGREQLEKYKSVGFTKVLILTRADFLNSLREFPQDYETYCKIRDDLIFNRECKYFNAPCFSCNSKDHKLISCPMVHYVPNKDLIIKRFAFNKHQRRIKLQRFGEKKKFILIDELREDFVQANPTLVQKSKGLRATPSMSNFTQRYTAVRVEEAQNLAKQRFVRIVNKVRLYNNVISRVRATINYNIDYFGYLQQLKHRLEQVKQLKNYPKNQINDLEFLILKLKNHRKYVRSNMILFEAGRSYHVYFPNFNQQDVINEVNSRSFSQRSHMLLKKFLPYLTYPGQFLKQFKLTKQYTRQMLILD